MARPQFLSHPGCASLPTISFRHLAPVAWVKCIGRATRNWAATSPTRRAMPIRPGEGQATLMNRDGRVVRTFGPPIGSRLVQVVEFSRDQRP